MLLKQARMVCWKKWAAKLVRGVEGGSAVGADASLSVCVCENTPTWHGQYLSCMVIASAAILLWC